MGERKLVSLILLFSYLHVAVPVTDQKDFTALMSLKGSWQNTPQSWSGSDPCGESGDGWNGIKCVNSHVTSIVLSSMDLTGQIPGDIGSLSELDTLDLSYNKGLTGSLPQEIGNLTKLSSLFLVGCGFTGPIPDNIGSLRQLIFLSLNFNNFSGTIPASIGNLLNLQWLDLTENQLEGSIPVSSDSAHGLDQLLNAEHFHLGKNKLSGTIPPKLFSSKMKLIHVLFDSNQLSGSIPSSLGLVQSLQLVRFDSNKLTGYLPENINNLTSVTELRLSNNELSGPLPNLSGMINLTYLDMSNNNRFDRSDFPPWLSTLGNLATLMMENIQLEGPIPVSFFSLTKLYTVVLKSNKLNGTLDIGNKYSNQLRQIELQHNEIDKLLPSDGVPNVKIILEDNPICYELGSLEPSYCHDEPQNVSYTAPTSICLPVPCSSDQKISPNCNCAYPYIGTLTFRTASPGTWDQDAHLEKSLMDEFKRHYLPVDSVYLENLTRSQFQDPQLSILVFPLGQDHFNRTGISSISSFLIVQPFYFIADPYEHDEEPRGSSKPSNTALIIGAAVGGFVMIFLLLLAGIYVFHQRKRAEKAIAQSNPFEHERRRHSSESKSINPQWKVTRPFSFAEVQKYTNNFSQANDIGSGGYGKVYRGTLPNGQLVAIKRSQRESKQGENEFTAEIELLSRVHHKNLVRLVGFCFDRGEQMLVYEYVPNGTLRDNITGKSGIRLDWTRRLKVALGAARGLTYLHEHVNPPIIHRDIKSTNILLDERLNAKVADFGLSKLMVDDEKDHVTTQVKGTMGYLDPDYYTSQQLTEKSDIYSFGVLMLELITARKPIEKGSYIVKVVRNSIDKTKELYGLYETLDPVLISGSTLKGFEKFLDLSMKCLEESRAERPKMSDVVKELESLLEFNSVNATAESAEASTSSIYDVIIDKGSPHDLYTNESLDSPVAPLQPKNDPKLLV